MKDVEAYTNDMGIFLAEDEVRIFYQRWLPAEARGLLVISHGLGEHSGRYQNLVQALAGSGIAVLALDHRGHGRSGGRRGHADDFAQYARDLGRFIDQVVREQHPGLPLLLLGHSMGGLIAETHVLDHGGGVDGLVLSAPACVPTVHAPGWKKALGLFFSRVMPTMTMASGLNPVQISTDSDVVERYVKDPLVHDRVTSRWYTGFLEACTACLERAAEIRVPLLVIHGGDDRIISIEGSRRIHAAAASEDKAIHELAGLFHETMNEAAGKKEPVLELLRDWIVTHAGGTTGRVQRLGRSEHQEGIFLAEDTVRIFYQSWTPARPRGVVVLCHGLGEHSDCFVNLRHALLVEELALYALDHRGHGRSGGRRGHVDSFDKYVSDLRWLQELIIGREQASARICLVGHELGAVVALHFALTRPERVAGLALSAAGRAPAPADEHPRSATADPAPPRDPLLHRRLSKGWQGKYKQAVADGVARAGGLRTPLLVLQSEQDGPEDQSRGEALFEAAGTADKELHRFAGTFHEAMTSPRREQDALLAKLSGWLAARLVSPGPAA